MKTKITTIAAVLVLAGASTAMARDDRLMFPVKDGLEKGKTTKDRIDPEIRLYFGKQTPQGIDRRLGEFTSSRKTNATNKTDKEACEISFVSTVVSLQQRARKEGGNAVVNIRSVYKQEDSDSPTEFICGAGKIMAGVALRGTVVKLK